MEVNVELTLKKKQTPQIPSWFEPIADKYKTSESGSRLVLTLPHDWSGFKDGTAGRILAVFGDSIYPALSFLSDDDSVIVTDLEGLPVDTFPVVINGRQYFKYVKRWLRIIRPLTGANGIYSITDYVLKMQYREPVMTVLDVYACDKDTGTPLDEMRSLV